MIGFMEMHAKWPWHTARLTILSNRNQRELIGRTPLTHSVWISPTTPLLLICSLGKHINTLSSLRQNFVQPSEIWDLAYDPGRLQCGKLQRFQSKADINAATAMSDGGELGSNESSSSGRTCTHD